MSEASNNIYTPRFSLSLFVFVFKIFFKETQEITKTFT